MDGSMGILLLNFSCAGFLCGIIWYVQLCHYPLLTRVGEQNSSLYSATQKFHENRTAWVVIPPMVLELVSALWIWHRPAFIQPAEAMWGALLVLVIWMSTFLIQAPLHARLGRAFDRSVSNKLTLTNWIRTAAWSARVVLLAGALGRQGYLGF